MKIAVLTSLYPSSVRPQEGIFAERRWVGMARRGHSVHVFHPQPRAPLAALGPLFGRPHWREIARMPARETRGGLPVERPRYLHVPGAALFNARSFARVGVAALLARGQPDVAVLDYAWPAALAVGPLREAGVPVVVNGRGSDVLQVAEVPALARELGRALSRSGHWCAVSRDLVAAMDRLAGVSGVGVLVANGVDLELFRPGDRGAARAGLGQAASGPLVLVVGHWIPRKDPLLALEAFARAAAGEARLVFVGSGPLGPLIERRARELGLGERVRLENTATPERLRDWYRAADVLLLTSSREGRPNVVLEALASGRPVVATSAGGTGELLEGLPGALVQGRDPGQIGAALALMLRAPPGPETCRGLVAALSWEACFAALEALLERARAAGRAP
jgi:teichuronic acid biosynthesis glycosyltransferase TuaC